MVRALAGNETGGGDGPLAGDEAGATVRTQACAAAGSGFVVLKPEM